MAKKPSNSTNSDDKPAAPSRPSTFFDKPWVLACLGVLALVLAYVFASWAIDSGSLLDWAIAVLLLAIGVRDLVVAAKRRANK